MELESTILKGLDVPLIQLSISEKIKLCLLSSNYQSKAVQIQREQLLLTSAEISSGLFIEKPGFSLIAATNTTEVGQSILSKLGIDTQSDPSMQLSEAYARQTYLNFLPSPSNQKKFLHRVIHEAGHRSVTKGFCVTSLFAGISIKSAIEIIQLGGAVGRTTSSKTKAMDATLYAVQGTPTQKKYLRNMIVDFLLVREAIQEEFSPITLSKDGREFFNMFNLQSKAVSFFHTMNLKEWYTSFKQLAARSNENPELRKAAEISNQILYHNFSDILDPLPPTQSSLETTKCSIISQKDLLDEIKRSGGQVEESIFVIKSGCRVIAPSTELVDILSSHGVKYLSQIPVQFRLSGIAFETVLELVAHSEATVRFYQVSQQDDTPKLHRIQGTDAEAKWQKYAIKKFLQLRQNAKEKLESVFCFDEISQILQQYELCTEAVSVDLTMKLSDFNKLFIGRLSTEGNEQEVQEICRNMCNTLQKMYPLIIKETDEYYGMNNDAKYIKE